MAHDRTYKIVESGIGGPPKGNPVLANKKGEPIPPDQLLIFNKHTDKMRKSDHYLITFEIKDFGNSALRFTPNREDVLWVKEGSGPGNCPTSRINDLSNTIWLHDMDEEDGEWIEVVNMDMNWVEFWFTLNLVDKANPTSTAYVPVDPGGGNQDGGAPFYSHLLIAGCLTGAVVGAGATVLASNAFVPLEALTFGIGGAVVGLIVAFVLDRL